MERKNRNIWIAVIVIAVVCCCCVAAVAAGALAWFVDRVEEGQVDVEIFDFNSHSSSQLDETFQVGENPYLEIRNFAGKITVRPSQDNVIHVVATKRGERSNALAGITVSMEEQGDRIVVRTRKANGLGSASVDLEITAPPGTEIDMHTGAGPIEFRDMTGPIRANSGAGAIEAMGAAGPVQLGTGAGSVRYEGTPAGSCRFESGAGEITLRLGANPDVRVDLGTGLGTVSVGYDVDGQTSARDVKGTIGNGDRGTVYAHTGIGSVSVRP